MADITLTVDVSSLADAKRKLDNFGQAVNKLSVLGLSRGVNTLQNNIRELVTAQQRGTISSSAYNLGILQIRTAYQRMGLSSAEATTAVRRYATELRRQDAAAIAAKAAADLAAANQRASQSYNQLRMSMDPVFAAQVRMKQAHDTIREALARGIITRTQAAQSLLQYRAALRAATAAGQQHAMGLNRTAVLTQQAGYQFGDFFVQIQSGTNFLVAFGQQATQLVGTMAMMATTTKMIAIFSGIGVLIAIGTAIGAALMRASGSSDTLATKLTKLTDVSSRLKEDFRFLKEDDLGATFGNMTEDVVALTQAMLDLNSAAEMRKLKTLLDSFDEEAKPGFLKLSAVSALGAIPGIGPGLVGDITNKIIKSSYEDLGISMARSQFDAYQKELMDLANRGDKAGVAKLITTMVEDATDFGETADQVSEKGYSLILQLAETAKAISETVALQNGSADAYQKVADSAKFSTNFITLMAEKALEAAEASKEVDFSQAADSAEFSTKFITLLAERAIKTAESLKEIDLSKLLDISLLERAATEEDRLENAARRRANEVRNIYRQQKADAEETLRLSTEQAAAESKAEDLARRKKDAFHAMAGEMSAVSSHMFTAAGYGEKLASLDINSGIALAASTAMTLANNLGVSFEVAKKLAAGGYEQTPTIFDPRDPRYDPAKAAQESQFGFVYGRTVTGTTYGTGQGAGSAGGGGGGAEPRDVIGDFQKQLDLERELVGTSEAYQKVRQALGEEFKTTSPVVIAGLVQQATETQRLIDLDNQRKDLMNTVKSSMEDAFMSMVDGTKSAKEAFKSMAAEIIKELYRVLVVQRLVSSISGFLMPSKGPAGSVAPPPRPPGLATGGSMMANRAYMVGENGPELVIPRHSGSVVNANQTANAMGGSGSVTVQNNITVTGSDSAMVRTEIAKMIPQITNATKAAVIDARLRGGQMKQAFR